MIYYVILLYHLNVHINSQHEPTPTETPNLSIAVDHCKITIGDSTSQGILVGLRLENRSPCALASVLDWKVLHLKSEFSRW